MSFDADTFKAFERAGWNQRAAGYRAVSWNSTRLGLDPVLDAAGVTAGMDVLDVATGPGYGAALAVARGARAIGVDFAAAMLEEARQTFPEVEFREGDAEALPFGDCRFDAVTCSFGMLHFARPERAIAESFRVLRPGGRYAFSAWCAAERVAHFGMFRCAIAAHGDPHAGGIPPGPDMFRFADPRECLQVLEAAGFRETTVKEIAIRRRVAPEALVKGLRHATVRSRALLDAQTPEARAAIEAALLEEARTLAGPDGILDLTLPAVLASGARGQRPGYAGGYTLRRYRRPSI
ncbi:MAG: methyltransferase domain-containing protein [Alphaproteobacteria bacterium]|nr:methyltransferase domain-containing protein [Alphaproteobacteria bacterium]